MRMAYFAGGIWATTIGASLAYTRKMTLLKPSLRLIHARMHAQAITLAVLSGAAAYHYYEKSTDKLEQNPDKAAKIHHPVA